MLYLVLALVVAAFGLLVAALTTSAMLWAWLSVGASVLAAVALVLDWWRRRQRRLAQELAAEQAELAGDIVEDETEAAEPAEVPEAEPVAELDPDTEPDEEDTDAADLLAVAELTSEVRVLDERPRYHLATCRWVDGRSTLVLPVKEARQLGFTPCAVCRPDRSLAAAHRRASRA